MTAAARLLAGQGALGMTVVQVIALLPALAVVLAERGLPALWVFLVAAAVALFWDAVFWRVRNGAPGAGGITTAMIFAVLTPADVAVWQVAVVVSLGAVVGELVFGGRGFGFLNAAAVSLALLLFSFPGTALPEPTLALALATVPGAALLLIMGVLSWRVVVTSLLVLWLAVGMDEIVAVAIIAAFPLVFLVGDPVAAASTNAGRVAYAILAGALIWIFGLDVQAVVFASLLASIFAPLADYFAIRANALQRGLRHG